MRICMLIPRLVLFREGIFIGGANTAMVHLSRALVEGGHTVSVICGSPEPEKGALFRKALAWAEVHCVPVRGGSPVTRGIQSFPGILLCAVQVCRRNECDLVHSHSGYPHWAGLAEMVGFITSRPAVHTLYCPLPETMNDEPHLLMNTSFARLSLSRIDRVVAISKNVQRSVAAAGVRLNHITVIPPPIDERRFNPQVGGMIMRQKLGLESGNQVVLFVGNLTRTKGLDLLLRAMGCLLSTHPRLRLVYSVERGPVITDEREFVIRELITDLSLGDRVIELGVVEDMPAVMAASDLFVVPYRSTDGPSDYPLAMLEAMAVGRPIAATRVGAIPEIIRDGHTGVLVAPDDPVDLARGIAALLADPGQARAMGETASQLVRERFAGIEIARATEQLYLEVLNQRAQKHGEHIA